MDDRSRLQQGDKHHLCSSPTTPSRPLPPPQNILPFSHRCRRVESCRCQLQLPAKARRPLHAGQRLAPGRQSGRPPSLDASSPDSLTWAESEMPIAARCSGGIEPCVIRAGCSIRLSTPPRLSASVKSWVRSRKRFVPARSRSSSTEIMPPKAVHLPPGDLVLRMAGEAGVDDAPHVLARLQPLGDLQRRWLECRSSRSASVFRPRSAKKLSNGPEMAPTAFCRNFSRSARSRLVAHHRHAADHVGMAVEIFRRRMHDDVDAELQRPLDVGAAERVVGGRSADLVASPAPPRLRGRRSSAAGWSASRPTAVLSPAGLRPRPPQGR